MTKRKISFVLPCFNEAINIPKVYAEIKRVLSDGEYEFEFLFVDDGSNDNTLDVVRALSKADPRVFYLELSRNFGHQAALKAGIDTVSGDCVITMDSDLQHPPEILPKMIRKWEEGNDIVYTKRRTDKKLSFFKRWT